MKSKFSGIDLSSQEYSKKVKSSPQKDSSAMGEGTKTRFLEIENIPRRFT